MNATKGKGSFYIAQYPVRWTAQSALQLNLENKFPGASHESRNSTSFILITSNSSMAFFC